MSMVVLEGQDGDRDGGIMDDLQQDLMVEVPQFGVLAAGKDIFLTIMYATMEQRIYLCNITNYEDVARKLHKTIMDAGLQAKRAATGLVAVEGAQANAVVRQAKGRQPGSAGS